MDEPAPIRPMIEMAAVAPIAQPGAPAAQPAADVPDAPKQRQPYSGAVKTVIAAIGFFCDSYDVFVINIVLVIFKAMHSTDPANNEELLDSYASVLSTAALIGAVLGQLSFGFLGDLIGRPRAWLLTTVIIIIGGIGSALSWSFAQVSLFYVLAFWRLILGLGIGGEYPLSATISAESSKKDTRGRGVSLVFSAQGVGMIAAPAVVLLFLSFLPLSLVWRLAFAFGAVPPLAVFYFRYDMHRREAHHAAHSDDPSSAEGEGGAAGAAVGARRASTLRMVRTYARQLVGVAGSWFLFDIVLYSNSLFSGTILASLNLGSDAVNAVALQSIILAALGLPGYFVAVALIDRTGRKALQIVGFVLLGATFVILTIGWDKLSESPYTLVIVYGLTFFFGNAGPNTTTFVLPAESFPHEITARCHGFAAAMGKMGAVVGAAVAPPLLTHMGPKAVFGGCVVVCLIGVVWTSILVTDTTGKERPVWRDPRVAVAQEQPQAQLQEETRDSPTGSEEPYDIPIPAV